MSPSKQEVQDSIRNNSIRECDIETEVPAVVPETVQTIGQLALYLMENNLI